MVTCQCELEGYSKAMAFQLVAGHPALDLVNTLDWRFRKSGTEELLKTYDDLLRFTEQSKLLAPKQTRELRRSEGERTLLRVSRAPGSSRRYFLRTRRPPLHRAERWNDISRKRV